MMNTHPSNLAVRVGRVICFLTATGALVACGEIGGKVPEPSEILAVPAIVTGTEELWIIARDSAGNNAAAALPYLQRAASTTPAPRLVLQHTDVNATVDASVATLRVQQKFHNPFAEAIDAEYVFSLPDDAAVSNLVINIGSRHIRGIVRPRREAEEMFGEMKERGRVVVLLSAEAPNVFRQRIANLAAGQDLDVAVTYFNTLNYRGGAYELVVPLRSEPAAANGGGTAAGLTLQVDVDAGMSIKSISSPSHDVKIEPYGDRRAHVELVEAAPRSDADFVLRIQTAGSTLKPGFLAHRDQRGGYFELTLQPPGDLGGGAHQPLEMIFVTDCSSTMTREVMAQARTALARALRRLAADDTFAVVGPAAAVQPLPASAENVERAVADLDEPCRDGGPALQDSLRTALQLRSDAGRRRLVVVLSDGRGGSDEEIAARIREELGGARILSLGVGPAPNRVQLEGMARLGRGAVAYLPSAASAGRDATEQGVDDFITQLHQPLLSGIEIDWGDLQVGDVVPRRIPDLFPGRPVVVSGRFSGSEPTTIKISGKAGGQTRSYTLDVSREDLTRSHPALASLWARAYIADIELSNISSPNRVGAARMEEIGLAYGIVSPYTALIATDGR